MPKAGNRVMSKKKLMNKNQNSNSSSTLLIEKSRDVDLECTSGFSNVSLQQANDMMLNINQIRDMIRNRKDPYDILEKIVIELTFNYSKCCEIIKKHDNENIARCKNLNDQLVSLENVAMDKINIIQEQTVNSIDAIDVTQKCKEEINFIWITFTDPAEIEEFRKKSKLDQMHEAEMILNRMNITIDDPSKEILEVQTQKVSVKSNNAYENEFILGLKFASPTVIKNIKRQINNYGKNQFMLKNFDLIRYSVRSYWSPKVWKLLRVCYDLKNFKLLENVNVTKNGIAVSYKKKIYQQNIDDPKLLRKFIRNQSDLNELRSEINDLQSEISTFQLYDGNYFKLGFDERKLFKENLLTLSMHSNNNINADVCKLSLESDSKNLNSPIFNINRHTSLFNSMNSSRKKKLNRA